MRGRVFKRGASWSYVVDVGKDPEGKRQQRMKGGFATRREAEQALAKVLHSVEAQQYVKPSKLTLAAYLREEWLPTVKPPKLREATWASYRAELEKQIIPTLGPVPLQGVNAVQLNKLYAHLLAEGRRNRPGERVERSKRSRGLSPRSVRYAHTILRKALADAVRWGYLARNPADLATPPTIGQGAPEMKTWTADELRRFLRHVQDDRLAAAWRLAASTGMRRGELLGLRWIDVDLDAARVAIRQALVMVGSQIRVSPPKTKRSRRTIDLDARTVDAVRGWRKVQLEECEAWGEAWQDLGLVFTREDGSAINPMGWSRTFERHAAAAWLPAIRLHDLRHTHATLMLAAGVHPKVASERLGHHSVSFTLDVYAHVIPGMQSDAASRVAELFSEAPDDPSTSEL